MPGHEQNPVRSEAPGRINTSMADGIGWIELDNLPKSNAVSISIWRAITDALAHFKADTALRCVVFKGDGAKAFCAGADIAEEDRLDGGCSTDAHHAGIDALRRIRQFPKPTLAMISGYCLGAGLALAMACDLRIAAREARLGIPAAKIGLPCAFEVASHLVALIGPAKAKWLLFTADQLSADEAQRIGLIDFVLSADELAAGAQSIAARIAANAPLTVTAAKFAVETALAQALERDLAGCFERERACLKSQDYLEGLRAVREQRSPVFQGR